MVDVYVRRRLVVGAGAAAVIGVVAARPLYAGGDDAADTPPTSGPSSNSSPSRTSKAVATPTVTAVHSGMLTAALDTALGARRGDVGLAVFDRRTRQTFTYHPSMPNVCASIVKALILTGIVRTRRAAGTPLTASDKALAVQMITVSDNNAATALFRRAGRAAGLQQVASGLGMTHTQVNSSWGLTTTTAPDQVLLMRAIAYGHPLLRADDRAYMLGLMGRVDAGQRFGVGTLPAGTTGVTVQVKNGWLPYTPGGWHDNTVGRVQGQGRDYAASILSTRNASDTAGRTLLTKAAGVVFAHLGH